MTITSESEPAIDQPGLAIWLGDCRQVLRRLPAGSVHVVISSPPYWGGVRDYNIDASVWGGDPDHVHQWGDLIPGNNRGGSGTPNGRNNRGEQYGRANPRGQFCPCGAWLGTFGNEPTPDLYCAHTVEIFESIRHAIRADGQIWWNIGDCYAKTTRGPEGNKALMPHRVGLALQAAGWIVRQDNAWHKPGPMPESLDGWRWERCRRTVAPKTYEPCPGCRKCAETGGLVLKRGRWRTTTAHEYVLQIVQPGHYFADPIGLAEPSSGNARDIRPNQTRNPRSVWSIATETLKELHFAAFPTALVHRCLRQSVSAHGCCDQCGAPFAPVVERKRVATRPALDSKVWKSDEAQAADGLRSDVSPNRDPMRHIVIKSASGYLPTCRCPNAQPVGSTVCDPFTGSGRTARVAIWSGQRFVGAEIAPHYLPIITTEIARPWFPKPVKPVKAKRRRRAERRQRSLFE